MIKIKSDKIIIGETLFDGFIYIENDKIVEISTCDKPCETFYNYEGLYVSAGFIEMHTHGGNGFAFINSTPEDVVNACNYHLSNGVTSILPTVTTGPFENMKEGVVNISKAIKSGKCLPNVIGAHLEGPYLSLAQCGAQCPDFITPPKAEDYIPFIEEYGDVIARWTYAPENDPNGEFCKYLTQRGICVSAGHTDAKYEDMRVAVDNGCNLITHLYSATSTITRKMGFRSLGVIESAYLEDDLFVEIIADGKHLPYELIKLIIKLKGTDKVALITDCLEIAGTDVKEGLMSGTPFIVEDGVCKLKDRSAFAGSIANATTLIKTIRDGCGYSLQTAVKMMTEVPANILNLNKGKLEKGKDADVIAFDEDINIKSVFVGGNKVK